MVNNELNILRSLLEENGHQVDEELLEIQFLSHPVRSSLNAITDTLDNLNIGNIAAVASIENLQQFVSPFITHVVIKDKQQFVLVRTFKNEEIVIYDGKSSFTINLIEFQKVWQGVVLLVDEYIEKFGFTIRHIMTVVVALILAIPFVLTLPTLTCTFSALCIAGISISVLVLQRELGYKNKISEKFCSSDTRSGCDDLIKGNLKLPFDISLGDISLVYFSLLFVTGLTQNFSLISFLGTLTIPIILFSVFYQAAIAKKWCKLCLAIVAILVLQLTLNFGFFASSIVFDWSFVAYFLAFISFLLVEQPLKKELKKVAELKGLKIEALKFRRNSEMFLAHHNVQKKLNTLFPDQVPEITLGNPKGIVQLIAITNPMCQPCAKAHETYIRLLEQYPNEVSIKLRFYVPVEDEKDPRMEIAIKLLMLSQVNPKEMNSILHAWYHDRTMEKAYLEKLNGLPQKEFINALKTQRHWCFANDINITPTLLINDKIFPDSYQIADIANFIEAIIEQEELKTTNNAYLSSYNI